MKRVLVTGGNGFIGKHLVNSIIEGTDWYVCVLDLKQADKEIKSDRIKYVQGDILDRGVFNHFNSIDTVYHLAAQTSSILSERDAKKDIETNVLGTLNVCEFASHCQSALVFTSSMAIYGNQRSSVNIHSVPAPTSTYGISKLACELLIKKYFKDKTNFLIARLFNVYGPGQDLSNLDQGMLSIFVAMALKHGEIVVKGSPDRTRDFIHVSDVTKFLLDEKKMTGNIANVATGSSLSVRELTVNICNMLGEDVRVKYQGGFSQDISKISCTDTELENTIPLLPDGLVEFLSWAKGSY